MSRYRRGSGFANSGLVVQTHLSDFAAEPDAAFLRDARGKDAINQSAERPPPGRLVMARLNGNYGRGQRREN
jgi:hypothetical protein